MSRWVAPVALLVAMVAGALALWSLLGGSSDTGSGFSPQGGDPKTRVCTACDTVSKAVQLQTNTSLGTDPVAQAAVAANARLALLGGGVYLANSLSPDTPAELAGPVRSFAMSLQEFGMNALTGLPTVDATQTIVAADGQQTRNQIADLCT